MQTSLSCRSLLCLGLFAAACSDPPAGSASSETGSLGSELTAAQCNYFKVNGKVRICHATGSKKNPYNVLNVDDQGCINGHAGHAGDYVAVNDPNCGGGGFLPPGAPCDATLACSSGYSCQAGTCQATDKCIGVVCNPTGACDFASCNSATGACEHEATTGNSCSDGNACTTADACQAGACTGGPALAVDDGDACTSDSCNPASGAVHTAVNPDDGLFCTTDNCDPVDGVTHAALYTDDGNACTSDSCDEAGRRVVHTEISTDDGNVCTIDSCDPSTGLSHTPVSNDDGDPCTADACDPLIGVSHTATTLPAATHQWTFNDGTAADSIGTADGSLLGGASIAQGALVVDNAFTAPNQNAVGQRMIAPVADTTTTKTLVAWVTLGDLAQRGGGALSLEETTTDGSAQRFDAIVYAEQNPQQWMAGSDWFHRSPANGGAQETSTDKVGIAIVYDSANGITIYREGQFYAGYTAGTLQTYAGGASDAILGLRHSGCGTNCWLSGQIDEARIYPVALNACQVKLLAPVPGFVSTGCSDGTREGFTSVASYPGIAACSGGWSIPGVRTSTTVNPACGRVSGNSSSNPSGAGCNVADLCSAGFHVCNNATEVASKTGPAGCNDAMVNDAFFIQREASYGYYACLDWSDLDQYQNDIWGCGGTGPLMSGLFTSKPCGVLNATTGDGGGSMAAPWNLNVGGLSSFVEAASVTKSGSEHGGVLCCAD